MTARKLFKDKDTEKVWKLVFAKKWSKELQKRTWKEMALLLSFTDNLTKLKETFGTDLEILKSKRKGQHSIRIENMLHLEIRKGLWGRTSRLP